MIEIKMVPSNVTIKQEVWEEAERKYLWLQKEDTKKTFQSEKTRFSV